MFCVHSNTASQRQIYCVHLERLGRNEKVNWEIFSCVLILLHETSHYNSQYECLATESKWCATVAHKRCDCGFEYYNNVILL